MTGVTLLDVHDAMGKGKKTGVEKKNRRESPDCVRMQGLIYVHAFGVLTIAHCLYSDPLISKQMKGNKTTTG